MALFSQPVPIPPHGRGSGAVREGDTIKALVETRGVIARISAFLAGFGVNTITGADGRMFDVLSKSAGGVPGITGGIPLDHPWTIRIKKIDSSWKAGISHRSDVYDGMTWTKKTVTGLFTSDAPQEDNAGWIPVEAGFVYLKGTVDSEGEITAINVEWGEAALSGIFRVKSAAGQQTEFAWVIGYLWSSGTGDSIAWYYRQEAWRHITLLYVVVNGVLCKVPFEM